MEKQEFPQEKVELLSPKTRFAGESVVTVTSALGSLMGQFLWPSDDLEVIRELGRRSKYTQVTVEGEERECDKC